DGHDVDLHPALACLEQGLQQKIVRHKIRCADDNAFGGGGNRQQIQRAHGVGAAASPTVEGLGGHGSRRLYVGEEGFALDHFVIGLDPVIGETALKLRDDRTPDFKVTVTPMGRILCVAKPFVTDAYASGEANLSIHNQDFPVRAIVHAVKVVPVQGTKEFNN